MSNGTIGIVSLIRQDRDIGEWIPGEPLEDWRIDALFEKLKGALKSDPYSATLAYDPTWGLPESVYFDYDERIADEEWGATITNLRVLD